MNKAAIYISLVFSIFLGLLFYTSYMGAKEVALSGDGLQFENFSKDEIINNFSEDILFIIKDRKTKTSNFFKVEKYTGGGKYTMLKHPIKYEDGSQPNYFISAMNGDLVFQDTLKGVPIEDVKMQVFEASKIEALKLIRYEELDGTFDFIDNSIFIFFGIAFIALLALFLLELPIFLGKHFVQKDLRNVTYILALIGGIAFLQWGVAPFAFPHYDWQVFIRPIILILPVFLVYQYLFRWRKKDLEFVDSEALKFVVIFAGIFLTTLFADNFAKFLGIDQVVKDSLPMNMAMGFSMALGNLLFNVIRLLWSNRGAKKKLAKAEESALESQSELDTLQSSVNPHFLYNSLNSIASLAGEDAAKTKEMAHALSAFYRYNTNREGNTYSTIGEEVEMIKTYLEIEKIRFEEKLNYQINVDDKLKNLKIPHFLLQPIVENAVKYGYNDEHDQIKIVLDVYQEGQDLKISINDFGAEFKADMQKGFGLKSVTKKLKLLYPGRHEVEFINAPSKKVLISLNS